MRKEASLELIAAIKSGKYGTPLVDWTEAKPLRKGNQYSVKGIIVQLAGIEGHLPPKSAINDKLSKHYEDIYVYDGEAFILPYDALIWSDTDSRRCFALESLFSRTDITLSQKLKTLEENYESY